jgi:hypothetical protein
MTTAVKRNHYVDTAIVWEEINPFGLRERTTDFIT